MSRSSDTSDRIATYTVTAPSRRAAPSLGLGERSSAQQGDPQCVNYLPEPSLSSPPWPAVPATTPARTATAGGPTVTAPAGDDVEFVSTLRNFGDCDGLLGHIRAEAISRVGPYGLDGGGRYGPVFFGGNDGNVARAEAAEAVPDSAPAPAQAEARTSAQAGSDFSGTNVQVIGVDEPDIVKTDGRRIIMVRNGTLTVVDVTGAEPSITGRVLLGERWGGELLLHGDRVLVINNHYSSIRPLAADSGGGRYSRDIVIIDEILLGRHTPTGPQPPGRGPLRQLALHRRHGPRRHRLVPERVGVRLPPQPRRRADRRRRQPSGRGTEQTGGLATRLPGGLLGGIGHRGGPDPGVRPGVRAVAVLRLRLALGADLRPRRVVDARRRRRHIRRRRDHLRQPPQPLRGHQHVVATAGSSRTTTGCATPTSATARRSTSSRSPPAGPRSTRPPGR